MPARKDVQRKGFTCLCGAGDGKMMPPGGRNCCMQKLLHAVGRFSSRPAPVDADPAYLSSRSPVRQPERQRGTCRSEPGRLQILRSVQDDNDLDWQLVTGDWQPPAHHRPLPLNSPPLRGTFRRRMRAVAPDPRNPLKIALVTDSYLPRLGGIELHVHDLAQRLAGAGHEVHVVSPFAGRGGEDPVRVHRLPIAVWPRWGFAWTPTAIYHLDAALKDRGFDVVHHHLSVFSPLAFASLCLCVRLGIPAVATFHSVWRGFEAALAGYDRLFGWTRRRVVLSAVSAAVAVDLERVAGGKPVHLLPNGTDPEFWRVEHRPAREGEVRVAAVMRLARRKRPRVLLEMAARARERMPPGVRLRVRVAGDGPERPVLRRMIPALGLEDTVELLGHQRREEIRALFAESDLFVLPTIEEAFGIAALEARAAGLPVVAMAGGGVAEIIHHGEEGLLARSDAEMVDHVVRLAADPALRARIARHNRSTPSPAPWPEVVERHLSVYRQAGEG
jgi:glycosyltransferase involved in cell wall biosynthesis